MEKKSVPIHVRVTETEYEGIKRRTSELGFKSVSEYIRYTACRESYILEELEKINDKLD